MERVLLTISNVLTPMNNNPVARLTLPNNLLLHNPVAHSRAVISLELNNLVLVLVQVDRASAIEHLFQGLGDALEVKVLFKALNQRDGALTALMETYVNLLLLKNLGAEIEVKVKIHGGGFLLLKTKNSILDPLKNKFAPASLTRPSSHTHNR